MSNIDMGVIVFCICIWGISLSVQNSTIGGRQSTIIEKLDSPIYQHCRVREQIKD